MDEVKLKSDKHCIDCKTEYRKEIVAEIRECCSKCPRVYQLDHDPVHRKPKKKSRGRK
ncbi:hypothetical protein [Anaerosolibacter sp.]|uniref:hypothetical protein n=1 Tax=Anaerosolibacter sp. TaxID=1872527 RepID=UPI0039F12224